MAIFNINNVNQKLSKALMLGLGLHAMQHLPGVLSENIVKVGIQQAGTSTRRNVAFTFQGGENLFEKNNLSAAQCRKSLKKYGFGSDSDCGIIVTSVDVVPLRNAGLSSSSQERIKRGEDVTVTSLQPDLGRCTGFECAFLETEELKLKPFHGGSSSLRESLELKRKRTHEGNLPTHRTGTSGHGQYSTRGSNNTSSIAPCSKYRRLSLSGSSLRRESQGRNSPRTSIPLSPAAKAARRSLRKAQAAPTATRLTATHSSTYDLCQQGRFKGITTTEATRLNKDWTCDCGGSYYFFEACTTQGCGKWMCKCRDSLQGAENEKCDSCQFWKCGDCLRRHSLFEPCRHGWGEGCRRLMCRCGEKYDYDNVFECEACEICRVCKKMNNSEMNNSSQSSTTSCDCWRCGDCKRNNKKGVFNCQGCGSIRTGAREEGNGSDLNQVKRVKSVLLTSIKL